MDDFISQYCFFEQKKLNIFGKKFVYIQFSMSDHIDKSVIKLFVIVLFISASILAYRATRYTPCKDVDFTINTEEFVVGKLIEFKDLTTQAKSWEWNLGDSSKVANNKNVLHSYEKPGEYQVSLKVNNACEISRKIVIKDRPFVLDTTKLAVFDLPESIKVGEELKVIDRTNNASKWEWRFGETAGINSESKVAKYTYESHGLKTVTLVVNGDVKHATSKQIMVLKDKSDISRPVTTIKTQQRTVSNRRISDAPTNPTLSDALGPKPVGNNAPKTVPNISEAQFKNKLILVSKRQAKPQDFEIYFCGDLNKSIIVNGKNMKFLEFCELLKIKKFKIKEVNLIKDDKNCINNVSIIRSKFL